jgi:hypothetical protein
MHGDSFGRQGIWVRAFLKLPVVATEGKYKSVSFGFRSSRVCVCVHSGKFLVSTLIETYGLK